MQITAGYVIDKLSDEQLEQAYKEIREWRTTGVLKDGVVRNTHNYLEKTNGTEISVSSLLEPFLWEIAVRKYENL